VRTLINAKNPGKKMTVTIEGEKNKNYRYHRRGKKIGGKKLSKNSLYLGV
jgi:hypothetical protein